MLSPTLRANTKPLCYIHRVQSNMEWIVINRNKSIKILLLISDYIALHYTKHDYTETWSRL